MERDYLWLNIRDLPYFRAMLRAVEARLIQQVSLPAPVLDLGSGDGHFASVTFTQLLDIGVDPALKPTREAMRRGAYRLLVQADGAKLPCADGSFASAVSNSVLEHVDNLEEAVIEVGRVLRSGAPFVFTVPNLSNVAVKTSPALAFTAAIREPEIIVSSFSSETPYSASLLASQVTA